MAGGPARHDHYPRVSPHTSLKGTAVQDRCVFVLATGRSGSTQLVDSLNQLPNYFIRGEQAGAFWHFYLTLRYLLAAWGESHEFARAVDTWHRSRVPLNETGGPRYGVEQHHEPVGGTLAPAQGLPTQSAVREEGRPGASTTEGVTGLRGGSDSLGETGRSIRGLKAEPAAAPAAVSLDAGGATASADALFIAAAEAAAKAAVETPGDPFHRSLSYPNFDRVKALYNHHAADRKMPWFNDLEPGRLYDAVRAFYSVVYGYHGPGVVSGFKEVRFVCGRAFPSGTSTYDDFAAFLAFLRLMCRDVKILLNTRRSPDMDSNDKLLNMLSRLRDGNAADTEATGFAPATATDTTATYETPTHGGEGAAAGGRDAQAGAGQQGSEGRSIASSAYLASNENNIGAANDAAITNSTGSTTSSSSTSASMSPRQRLASYLAATHTWFDRYASDHPGVAMRVLMEDMFTPGVNVSLSRRLLSFLGEDPSALTLRFDRMPSWGARSKRYKQGRGGGGSSRGSSGGSGSATAANGSKDQGHVGVGDGGGRHGEQSLDLPLMNKIT